MPISASVDDTVNTKVPDGEFSNTLAVYGRDTKTGGESFASSTVMISDATAVSAEVGLTPTSAICKSSINDDTCSRSSCLAVKTSPVVLLILK